MVRYTARRNAHQLTYVHVESLPLLQEWTNANTACIQCAVRFDALLARDVVSNSINSVVPRNAVKLPYVCVDVATKSG